MSQQKYSAGIAIIQGILPNDNDIPKTKELITGVPFELRPEYLCEPRLSLPVKFDSGNYKRKPVASLVE